MKGTGTKEPSAHKGRQRVRGRLGNQLRCGRRALVRMLRRSHWLARVLGMKKRSSVVEPLPRLICPCIKDGGQAVTAVDRSSSCADVYEPSAEMWQHFRQRKRPDHTDSNLRYLVQSLLLFSPYQSRVGSHSYVLNKNITSASGVVSFVYQPSHVADMVTATLTVSEVKARVVAKRSPHLDHQSRLRSSARCFVLSYF